MRNAVFERDLLYSTNNLNEPGSVHVKVFNPSSSGKMPVTIENKTSHSPLNFLNSILRVMQSDIFDRIHIEIKASACIYIYTNDEIKREFGDKKYILVTFDGDNTLYKGVDEIEF